MSARKTPLTPALSPRERRERGSSKEEQGEGRVPSELSQHSVPSLHWFALDRRRFLQIFGGGIAIAAAAPRDAFSQESGRARQPQELPRDLAAWLHIDKDGKVTVFTGKVEMGQNIRTSLAQQVAEELRVGVGSITMVMGDTDLVPWDAGTFGSRTTPTMGPQLRAVAATARETLLSIAASRWQVPRDGLAVGDGKVVDAAWKRSLTYGELTKGEKLVKTLPADLAEAPVTPAAKWKIAGAAAPKVDGRDFVTGAHRYASDMTRPGMLYGKVLRAPRFEATLVSIDPSKAQALRGVRVVRDGDFAGVVAPDAHTAQQAIQALAETAKWTEPAEQPPPSSATIFDYFKKNADAGGASERSEPRVTGDVEQGLASADVRLSQTYTVQYIAHAPLETRAAVAEWTSTGDKVTVWTGTQRPFAVRDELATAFRMPSERARVIVPDTGSAYGGKHTGDAAVEAARLAKAAGKPVSLRWTRKEEFTWAYFRPAAAINAEASLDGEGNIATWHFVNVNSGNSAVDTPYRSGKSKSEFVQSEPPLRHGSYRALASTANIFARECFMDELAELAGKDPLEFRLAHLGEPRLRAVLEEAAKRFDWPRRSKGKKPNVGVGLACGTEKAS